MNYLYSLIVKNAGLEEIHANAFDHMTNLMTLDLSGNELRAEPAALTALQYVSKIKIKQYKKLKSLQNRKNSFGNEIKNHLKLRNKENLKIFIKVLQKKVKFKKKTSETKETCL